MRGPSSPLAAALAGTASGPCRLQAATALRAKAQPATRA